jgi:hypothetical protein
MIEFMKSNYYDPYIAQFVLKKPIKLKTKVKIILMKRKEIDKFDELWSRLPVLIKKYIKQNKVVAVYHCSITLWMD